MDEVLVVGSVAFDTIETRAGCRKDILGGSASFASLAGVIKSPFRIVAVVGEDFPEEHLALFQRHGVDTAGIDRKPGRTFRWSGRYAPDFSSRETLDTQLNVFESFDPVLPEHYRRSGVLFLGNIVPALQLKVLDQMSVRPRLVAADTMNFWISGMREQLLEGLSRIDMLLINDEEALQLSGEWSMLRAARAVQAMGPRTLIVKRGEHGAFLFEGDDIFYCPGVPLAEVIDPTGAGDSFAGGLLSWLAHHGPDASLREALVWATAVASIGVEGFGTDRFHDLTEDAVLERVDALRHLVAIGR
jgi:sugar/nucleoside kinase (ribokinase family)